MKMFYVELKGDKMSSFLIELTDNEIMHTYLALQRAINGNTNMEAVNVFQTIKRKLEPYVDDSTKLTATIMQITHC